MGNKVLLLGLGMQGKAALYDLANSGMISEIVVVDEQPGLLTPLDVPYESVIPALERHNIRVVRRELTGDSA